MGDWLINILTGGAGAAAAETDALSHTLEGSGLPGGIGVNLSRFVRGVSKSVRIALILGTVLSVLVGGLLLYLFLAGKL